MNTEMPTKSEMEKFLKFPFESVFQKTEMEIIARNIMIMRNRLGKWDISQQEYVIERNKDSGYCDPYEESTFQEVYEKIATVEQSKEFSKEWR